MSTSPPTSNLRFKGLWVVSEYSDQQIQNLKVAVEIDELDRFLESYPPPQMKSSLYYGLSKLLLERLLLASSKDRKGKILLVRPALIVGENTGGSPGKFRGQEHSGCYLGQTGI